jgi:hypothetical protein
MKSRAISKTHEIRQNAIKPRPFFSEFIVARLTCLGDVLPVFYRFELVVGSADSLDLLDVGLAVKGSVSGTCNQTL